MSSGTLSLPDLSSDYPLTEEQIAEYRQNGHLLLRGVCSPEEVAAHRQVFREVIRRYHPNAPKMEDRDVFHKAFLSATNTWVNEEATRPFIFSRRFAKLATELMGADGVRLYHNQAFFKEPGGGPTPWHQDHYYWPLDTEKMITIWIALVDITPEMGAITFATGSHRAPFLDEMGISDHAMAYFDRIIAERGWPVVNYAMRAGDATFHAGWTLHSASANRGERAREASAVSYYADGAYVMKELTPTRRHDMEACMPGVQAGELGVGDRNPLIYRK
jgi:ectoine hydroxylase-related dioxygenase (phytanoyl-CoA dioxygenase family)